MRRPEGGGWRCSYGTWHGIDEHCRCAPPNLYLDAVLRAAFPAHDRMLTALADRDADRAAQAYRARIADEDAYWAGLYGVRLTGTHNHSPRRAA